MDLHEFGYTGGSPGTSTAMFKKIGWVFAALISLAAIVLLVLLQRADTESLVPNDEPRGLAAGLFVEFPDGWQHYDVAGPESG